MKILFEVLKAFAIMIALTAYIAIVSYAFREFTINHGMLNTIEFFAPDNFYRTVFEMAQYAGLSFAVATLLPIMIAYIIIDQNKRRRSK